MYIPKSLLPTDVFEVRYVVPVVLYTCVIPDVDTVSLGRLNSILEVPEKEMVLAAVDDKSPSLICNLGVPDESLIIIPVLLSNSILSLGEIIVF